MAITLTQDPLLDRPWETASVASSGQRSMRSNEIGGVV